MADVTWHLYVIRTTAGFLYAGITTDVERRYRPSSLCINGGHAPEFCLLVSPTKRPEAGN